MQDQEKRNVSLGTIVMLSLTGLVLLVSCIVLPRLMGSVNIHMEDRAMLSSTNLNDSLPELTMSEIPITQQSDEPSMDAVPTAMATPVPTITPEPVITPEPAMSGTIVLTFAGSINIDDLTRKSGYYSDSGKYDYTENLSLISGELDSDYTLVTLECITDPTGNVRQIPNAPDEVMDMLASANVDMVALGYNRAMDRGIEGVSATVSQATQRGLDTLGAYATADDAARFRIVDVNGVNVAYLHYATAITSTGKRKMNADEASFAMPMASISNGADGIASDIRMAREKGAQIVIVCINWSGQDSVNTTSTKMKNFMQDIADAGADLIIGSGTKAVREVSWIVGNREDGTTRQTLCAWSLGSLLNGERGNGNVTGMILHVQMSLNGGSVNFERITYTPTYIWRFKQDDYYRYRVVASDQEPPEGMDDSQAANAARAFENLKKALGSSPVTLRVKE